MVFDFTNYTYSGLLSILAALFGLGYPLIMQSVERIHLQYDSDLISRRFVKERTYLAFQITLAVNLLLAVILPFLLNFGKHVAALITIQTVALVWLIGCFFLLFRLILTYSNARALLHHIEGKEINKNNVLELFDIAVYADTKHNIQLYIDSMSDVFAYIQAQQGDQPNMPSDTVLPAPTYDEITEKIVFKIKNYLRKEEGHQYLHGNNDIVSVLYNQVSYSRLGLQAHQWLWMLLNDAVQYDNKSWFTQYWQFADSYANLKYHYLTWNSPLKQDKREFMLRHVMIGALLVHHKRLDWLNDILFFSHSEPAYYGLIPSSFAEIIDMLEQVESVCQTPLFQQQNFYFSDGMYSIQDEKTVFAKAVRYLSLLVIRLWSLEKRNLMHSNHLFSIPVPPMKLKEEEREAGLMEMMMQFVGEWYDADIFSCVPSLQKAEKQQVVSLLDSYRASCLSCKKEHEEHPTVSQKKFNQLLSDIQTIIKAHPFSFPKQTKKVTNQTIYTTDIVSAETIETLHLTDYVDIGFDTIAKVAVGNFVSKIYRQYICVLETTKRLAVFSVPRKQIGTFLQLIGRTNEYTVIASDDFPNCKDIDITLRSLTKPLSLFIVRNEDVPTAMISPLPGSKLTPLYNGAKVCSNISELLHHHQPEFQLQLGTQAQIFVPNATKGYVRIDIDDSMGAQNAPVAINKKLSALFA